MPTILAVLGVLVLTGRLLMLGTAVLAIPFVLVWRALRVVGSLMVFLPRVVAALLRL